MKFNYEFKFTPVEANASRQVRVSVNGTDPVITDCENDQVTLEFAINEQVSVDLINNDAEGKEISSRAILRTHKVTGATFKPDTLEGTTITVSKVGEEAAVEPPEEPPTEPPVPPTDGAAPAWPKSEVPPSPEDESTTASEPSVMTDPANPDASE